MYPEQNITVVFLMWLPYGFERFKQFIESYCIRPAGIAHQLLIIFKDEDSEKPLSNIYFDIIEFHKISCESLRFSGGLDIDAYLFAAKHIKTELVVFFNTSSVIIADNWLQKMHRQIIQSQNGMVAATGSWQSYRTTILHQHTWKYENKIGLVLNFKKYKLLLKTVFYYPFLFKSFPNPHLRTNSFIIRKDLFLSLKFRPITSKFDAYKCESGKNSITRQVMKKGYETLIIDKHGKVYKPNDWYDSRTFFSDRQQNLMVADNQTIIYEAADELQKRNYRYQTWGKYE